MPDLLGPRPARRRPRGLGLIGNRSSGLVKLGSGQRSTGAGQAEGQAGQAYQCSTMQISEPIVAVILCHDGITQALKFPDVKYHSRPTCRVGHPHMKEPND